MKKSIRYLPNKKQRDLNRFVQMILERIPQTQLIILYGSYARNEYVDFDERVEFGVPTSYRSDYDLLVVTHGIKDKDAGHKLDNIENLYSTPSVNILNSLMNYYPKIQKKRSSYSIC